MKLICVRHGETDWNHDKRLMGRFDVDLNESGINQAHELLSELPLGCEIIYTSPLKRARQTAEIISNYSKIPVVVREELLERNFGILAGKTWDEMQTEHGTDFREVDRRQEYDYRPFGGESAEEVKKRLLSFIEWLKQQPRQSVLIVCHAGIIRLMYFLFKKSEMSSIKNGSVHEFNL